jgi:hypothetical protein
MMITFREFVQNRDVKTVLFDILDPEDAMDKEDKSFLTDTLKGFNNRHKLLTDPSFNEMIRDRDNRGAIIQAIQNDSTTVGQLLALLTQQPESPKYLG